MCLVETQDRSLRSLVWKQQAQENTLESLTVSVTPNIRVLE